MKNACWFESPARSYEIHSVISWVALAAAEQADFPFLVVLIMDYISMQSCTESVNVAA